LFDKVLNIEKLLNKILDIALNIRFLISTNLLLFPTLLAFWHLPLSSELEGVSSFPCLVPGATDGLVELVTFSETSGFLAGAGKTFEFSVFVDWLGDPVHVGVSSDDLVHWVDHDDFVVLVGTVFSGPVAVDDSETAHSFTGSLFSNRLDSSLEFKLVNSLVDWFTVGGTLWRESLSATSSYSHSVDDVALLGFVAQESCFLWSRWSASSVDSWELSEVPRSKSEDVLHDIALLLSPKFVLVLVSTHVFVFSKICKFDLRL